MVIRHLVCEECGKEFIQNACCNSTPIRKYCSIGCRWNEKNKLLAVINNTGDKNPYYGRKHSEETKEKIRETHTGVVFSEEHIKNVVNSHKYGKDPNRKRKRNRKRKYDENYNFKWGNHTNECKIHMNDSKKGIKLSDEHIKKNKKVHIGFKHSEETKKKISRASKERMSSEEHLKKLAISMNLKPNKKEKSLNSILSIFFPNEYKFVRDFKLFINRGCPDFCNINGQRKLIELFGEYWHNPIEFPDKETEEDRINRFKMFGYDTLVIWENDLKNINVIKTLIEYHKSNNLLVL